MSAFVQDRLKDRQELKAWKGTTKQAPSIFCPCVAPPLAPALKGSTPLAASQRLGQQTVSFFPSGSIMAAGTANGVLFSFWQHHGGWDCKLCPLSLLVESSVAGAHQAAHKATMDLSA
eukprot:1159713-Pelagomonas_calceolata.AAC.10